MAEAARSQGNGKAKARKMGSNTIITRKGDDGSIRLHGSHLWAPVDHTAGMVAPLDHGLVGWTIDPATAFGTSEPTGGVLSLARISLGARSHHALSSVWVSLAAAGQGLNHAYLGVYAVASDLSEATLVGSTADASSMFGAAGEINVPLQSPVTVRGGHRAWVFVGLLVGGAQTMPSFRGAVAQSIANVNMGGLSVRYATVGSGMSSLPDSITGPQVGGLGCLFWAALG
jgi:hypothetical protein